MGMSQNVTGANKYMVTFIVEGKSDAKKVRKAMNNAIYLKERNKRPHNLRSCRDDFSIIITNGTRLNESIILQIELSILLGNRVYLLADPDAGGDLLSKMVEAIFPTIPRITLNADRCINRNSPKRRRGVEFCEDGYLRNILAREIGKPYDLAGLKDSVGHKTIVGVNGNLLNCRRK